jgi:hypothetical protein
LSWGTRSWGTPSRGTLELGDSELGNSELGDSELGNSELGGSELGNSELGGSELGNSELGNSDLVNYLLEIRGGRSNFPGVLLERRAAPAPGGVAPRRGANREPSLASLHPTPPDVPAEVITKEEARYTKKCLRCRSLCGPAPLTTTCSSSLWVAGGAKLRQNRGAPGRILSWRTLSW